MKTDRGFSVESKYSEIILDEYGNKIDEIDKGIYNEESN